MNLDSGTFPLVSVLMPAFNEEMHIERAIACILEQDYRHLEILVIDNGSSDKTVTKVQQMSLVDARIRLLLCTVQGAANARNCGLQQARGEYIVTMDADDDAPKDRISKLLTECRKYPLAVVGSACNLVNPQGEVVETIYYPQTNGEIRPYFNRLWNRSVMMPGTAMITASLFKQVGYLSSMRFLEDWDMILRMSDNPDVVFVNLAEPLYYYKLNLDSVSFDWRLRNRYNLMLLWNQLQRKRGKQESLDLKSFEKRIFHNPLYFMAYQGVLFLKLLQHRRWIKNTKAKLGI